MVKHKLKSGGLGNFSVSAVKPREFIKKMQPGWGIVLNVKSPQSVELLPEDVQKLQFELS